MLENAHNAPLSHAKPAASRSKHATLHTTKKRTLRSRHISPLATPQRRFARRRMLKSPRIPLRGSNEGGAIPGLPNHPQPLTLCVQSHTERLVMAQTVEKPKKRFVTRCVESTAEDICSMVDRARKISAKTFFKRTQWKTTVRELGYTTDPAKEGPRIEDDYHVSFYSSRFKGKPCYFFDHSAIEYVFA